MYECLDVFPHIFAGHGTESRGRNGMALLKNSIDLDFVFICILHIHGLTNDIRCNATETLSLTFAFLRLLVVLFLAKTPAAYKGCTGTGRNTLVFIGQPDASDFSKKLKHTEHEKINRLFVLGPVL